MTYEELLALVERNAPEKTFVPVAVRLHNKVELGLPPTHRNDYRTVTLSLSPSDGGIRAEMNKAWMMVEDAKVQRLGVNATMVDLAECLLAVLVAETEADA